MLTLITRLKETQRLGLCFVLGASVLMTLTLLCFRIAFSGSLTHKYFAWNLFLACIPLAISTLLVLFPDRAKSSLVFWPAATVWLLFFPNAPYIITDLFHFRPRPGVPYWFDLVLMISAVWNGLMIGLISLADMQHLVLNRQGRIRSWIFAGLSVGLCSFGIYLGRFGRWNSWDVLLNPLQLFGEIAHQIANPFSHPRTLGVTLLFAAFLGMSYLLLKIIAHCGKTWWCATSLRSPSAEP